MITSKCVGEFGEEKVFEFELKNKNGITVNILNLGGIITGIFTPDKNNNFENIVLAFDDIKNYYNNPTYYGCIIGRTSGRIYNGEITIDDKKYTLNKNYGDNSSHGGNEGFNKKIWDVTTESTKDTDKLTLTRKSHHLEESYPGEVDIKVIYQLNDNNELLFEIEATSTENTLVNITNHSYFNLSGNYKNDILDHKLKIDSSKILQMDNDSVVTGKYYDITDTPFDFRDFHKIGERIEDKDEQLLRGSGYDHTFMLDIGNKITLTDENSGRNMEIETNQESVVVYSMNFADELTLKGDIKPKRRLGICFETQAPPIGYNEVFKEKSYLKKGSTYSKYTKYRFF